MDSCQTEHNSAVLHLELVRLAAMAPTPDNNQPWRFVSAGDRLEVHIDRRRSLASDVNSMFDLMGIGAAIENAVIAASVQSVRTSVEYIDRLGELRDSDQSPLVATLRFSPDGEPDPLYDQIEGRCTNRRMYSTAAPEHAVLERLSNQAHDYSDLQLDWIQDRRRIGAMARLIAVSDRMRFEYEPFHREIFQQLRFTSQEVEATRDGLDIRTFELPPGAAATIHWLRRWSRMKLVNTLGLGKLLTFPTWMSIRKSGALGVLSLTRASAEGFLRGGRALERIWLAAQAENLALQPLGSLPIFIGHMAQLQGRNLHARHQKLATKLAGRFGAQVPSAAGRTLLMVLRIGQAEPPTARSLRRPTDDLFVQTADV